MSDSVVKISKQPTVRRCPEKQPVKTIRIKYDYSK